jgi:hypothetical protein
VVRRKYNWVYSFSSTQTKRGSESWFLFLFFYLNKTGIRKLVPIPFLLLKQDGDPKAGSEQPLTDGIYNRSIYDTAEHADFRKPARRLGYRLKRRKRAKPRETLNPLLQLLEE